MAGNPLASLPGFPQRPPLARSSPSETRLTQPGIEGARSRKLNSAPTAAFRIIAISSRPATRAGGLKTAPESNFPPIAARGASRATPLQRQEFFRAPPLSLPRSGYALTPERQRRRILILVVALPCPRRIPSRARGVNIGRERGSRLDAI